MIYEYKRFIIDEIRKVRHWFRALFCKNVRLNSRGFKVCIEQCGYSKYYACDYETCPKLKELCENGGRI